MLPVYGNRLWRFSAPADRPETAEWERGVKHPCFIWRLPEPGGGLKWYRNSVAILVLSLKEVGTKIILCAGLSFWGMAKNGSVRFL